MSLRQTIVLEENNTIVSLGMIFAFQVCVLSLIAFKGFEFFFSESASAVCTIILLLIIIASRLTNCEKNPQFIIHKNSNQKMMYVNYLYIPLPFFSSFKLENVNQVKVKKINQIETLPLMSSSINILMEAYGSYIVEDEKKFNALGGHATLVFQCLKTLKKNIREYHESCTTFQQKELDKASKQTLEQIQDEFGVEFLEISSIQATFQ